MQTENKTINQNQVTIAPYNKCGNCLWGNSCDCDNSDCTDFTPTHKNSELNIETQQYEKTLKERQNDYSNMINDFCEVD